MTGRRPLRLILLLMGTLLQKLGYPIWRSTTETILMPRSFTNSDDATDLSRVFEPEDYDSPA